jgi:hypothetical protein
LPVLAAPSSPECRSDDVRQGRRVRRAPHARCDAHTCRQLRLPRVHLGAERERLIEFRSEVLGDPRALGHDVRAGAELFAPRRDDGCALSSLTVIVAPTMGIDGNIRTQHVAVRWSTPLQWRGAQARGCHRDDRVRIAQRVRWTASCCPDGCTHEVCRAPRSSDSLMLSGVRARTCGTRTRFVSCARSAFAAGPAACK